MSRYAAAFPLPPRSPWMTVLCSRHDRGPALYDSDSTPGSIAPRRCPTAFARDRLQIGRGRWAWPEGGQSLWRGAEESGPGRLCRARGARSLAGDLDSVAAECGEWGCEYV